MAGKISGELFTGLKKGAYYLKKDHYADSIKRVTGFRPYPGTLNLRVNPEDRAELLQNTDSERIEEAKVNGTEYIGMDVHEVSLQGIEAAVLDLDLTDHGDDVIEIVAPIYLRGELDIVDGDEVEVSW